MSGSVPFVDGARIFALATGVTATNTVERLSRPRRAARASPSREIRAWCDAFEYMQLLRLREQHRARRRAAAPAARAANPNLRAARRARRTSTAAS